MNRSGAYRQQPTGYKAFLPAPLPPNPPIKIEGELQNLLSNADMSLARLDGLGHILPNASLFIAMYVKKEALLSSQIEGTQASLEDLFEFESGMKPENINDVAEVVNYVKALNYGMERLQEFPMSLRLIKEIHAVLMEGVRGGEWVVVKGLLRAIPGQPVTPEREGGEVAPAAFRSSEAAPGRSPLSLTLSHKGRGDFTPPGEGAKR